MDHKHDPLDVTKPPSAGTVASNDVYFAGESAENLLANRERLRSRINQLVGDEIDIETEEGRRKLRQILARLNDGGVYKTDGNRIPKRLQGVAGIYGRSLLRLVALGERTRWRGLIGDFRWHEREENRGDGHLSVELVEEIIRPLGKNEIIYWHLDIEVKEDGFVAKPFSIESGTGSFPTFPVELPRWTLANIKKFDLNYKLHASNENVEIVRIFRNDELLDVNQYEHLYKSKENCVDIFTNGKPPHNVIELRESTSAYCMGRCGGELPILNTH